MLNAKRSFSKVSEQLQTLARLAVDGETSALLDHVSAMTGARAAFWVHDERCWGGGPSLGRARPRAVEAGWLLDDAVLREHRSGAGSGVLLLLGELEDAEQILPIVVSWLDAHGVLLAQTLQREEATQRYDMLLDVTFEGLAVHRGGVLIEVNEALAQLYGYTREQMLGMRVADTIAPEAVDHVSRRIKSGFDGYYETVALRKDGSHVPLEARGRACIFDGREARVASFRDLRDRMRAEAALEQARAAAVRESQLKTVFLGNISHEVRTPMTAILGLVDIMLGSGLSPEQGHMMERLRGSAHGLIDLLDQVLDVTRIEEGRASVHLASFDLRATIVDSAASARRVREGVDLQFSIDPGIEDLWLSDASRVRQVLINLLDNASKYTESGHVALRVTRWSEGLVFEVEDSGRGLSQDELSSVFDRFVRGQRDVDVGSGAGLGLHITRQVVALLGGRLSVMSEEGVGSTFSVHLPMVQASPMPVEVLHGRRVLLLDGCSVMDEVERHLIYLGATCVRDVSEVWDSGFSCHGVALPEAARGRLVYVGMDDEVVHWSERGFVGGISPPVTSGSVARALLLAATVPVASTQASSVGVSYCDVLLAEDNEDLQMVIRAMIEHLGHKVTVVGNGVAAIEACADKEFDLVLMDVQMPLMDGLTAVRMLRSRQPSYTGCVVALTAHAMSEHAAICYGAGMDEYMCKPINMKRLRALLDERSLSLSLK